MTDEPEDASPERVRVTGPPRRRTPATWAADSDDDTPLGDVYSGSLVRAQLRLAMGVLAVMGLTLCMLPLLFRLVPDLASVDVAGLPLPWLLLGVVVYPVLVVLGWVYVHRAERNEAHFAELVEEGER